MTVSTQQQQHSTERIVYDGIPIDNFICSPDTFLPNYGFFIPLAEPDTYNEEDFLERTNWNQVALESSFAEPSNCLYSTLESISKFPNVPECQESGSLLEGSCREFESVAVHSESSEVNNALESSVEINDCRDIQDLYRPVYSVEGDSYSSRVFESTVCIPPPATVVFAGSIYDSKERRSEDTLRTTENSTNT